MLFQTRQAAWLLGMEPWQIQSYAKQGFVEPAKDARGAGTRRAYDVIGLLKLAVLHRLSEDGFDLRMIRPLFQKLFETAQPSLVEESGELVKHLQRWFDDRVLITCRRFRQRKIVKKQRLGAAVSGLLPKNKSLYFIDLGHIVSGLLERIEKIGNDHE